MNYEDVARLRTRDGQRRRHSAGGRRVVESPLWSFEVTCQCQAGGAMPVCIAWLFTTCDLLQMQHQLLMVHPFVCHSKSQEQGSKKARQRAQGVLARQHDEQQAPEERPDGVVPSQVGGRKEQRHQEGPEQGAGRDNFPDQQRRQHCGRHTLVLGKRRVRAVSRGLGRASGRTAAAIEAGCQEVLPEA